MILTPDQAYKSILAMLYKSVEKVPEARRDAVLETILNRFSGREIHKTEEKLE